MRFALLCLSLTACFERQYDCDNSAHASVSVTLRAADSEPIEEPWVRYTLGGESGACDEVNGSWLCGYELAGDILIEAGGLCHGDASQTVTVAESECHVINQDLELLLDPVDCTAEELPAVYVTVAGDAGAAVDDAAVGCLPVDADWMDYEPCEAYNEGFSCCWGWSGLIDLEVEAPGYQSWTGQAEVLEDCCGPVTEQVDVVLDEEAP